MVEAKIKSRENSIKNDFPVTISNNNIPGDIVDRGLANTLLRRSDYLRTLARNAYEAALVEMENAGLIAGFSKVENIHTAKKQGIDFFVQGNDLEITPIRTSITQGYDKKRKKIRDDIPTINVFGTDGTKKARELARVTLKMQSIYQAAIQKGEVFSYTKSMKEARRKQAKRNSNK